MRNIKLTLRKTIHILLAFLLLSAFDGFSKKFNKVKHYKNGNVKYEYVQYANQLVCITSYYENGQVSERGYYKRGERHGWFQDFSENGTKKTTAFYLNDKKDGLWTFYDETGKIKEYVFFENNHLVKTTDESFVTKSEFSD